MAGQNESDFMSPPDHVPIASAGTRLTNGHPAIMLDRNESANRASSSPGVHPLGHGNPSRKEIASLDHITFNHSDNQHFIHNAQLMV